MKSIKRLLILLSIFCILIINISAYGEVRIAPKESNLDTGKNLMEIYVLDINKADCILIQYKGKSLLVDLGKAKHYPKLNSLLKSKDVKEISVFNTHPHKDHIGGIFELLADYNVNSFYTAFPDYVEDTPMQAEAIKWLNEHKVPIHRIKDGDKLAFDKDISIDILQNINGENVNERSAVLYIKYNNSSILLTADILAGTQKYLAAKYGDKLKSDIMKAPHHAKEKPQSEFLNAVAPEFVFITNQPKGTKRMRKTLQKNNIPHLYAYQHIIHMVTDGTSWYVEQIGED